MTTAWPETRLARLLGVRYPIVQAPMAGGVSTPELAAAVSEAGGLGSLGLAYTPPDEMRQAIGAVRARTDRPFGVNLFVFETPPPGDLDAGQRLLDPYRRELGLRPSAPPGPPPFSRDDQLQVVLDERPAVFSFTFGIVEASVVEALHEREVIVLGTATTVTEAMAVEAGGVDAVVAQGAEAGGHRGTFVGDLEEALIGSVALVPQVADAVRVPVVAAGGIMDGRGIAAALALGASGVQIGTAFIPTPESGAHEVHKRTVVEGDECSTVVTPVFTGRHARGIRNRLVRDLDTERDRLAAFPFQAAVSADVREEATRRGERELMTMLAGQGLRLARELPAAELVATLVRETETTLGLLCR